MSALGEQLTIFGVPAAPEEAPAEPVPRKVPQRAPQATDRQLDMTASYEDPAIATLVVDPPEIEGWREELATPRPTSTGECLREFGGYGGPDDRFCPFVFCRHHLVTDIVEPSGDVEGAAKRYVVNRMNGNGQPGRRRSWAVDAPDNDPGWAELEAEALAELDEREEAGYPTCSLATVQRRIIDPEHALAEPMTDAKVGQALGVSDDQARDEAKRAQLEAEDEMDRQAARRRRGAYGPLKNDGLVRIRSRPRVAPQSVSDSVAGSSSSGGRPSA